MQKSLVSEILEQTLHQRETHNQLIHHSDLGVQYLSIKYCERVIETSIDA